MLVGGAVFGVLGFLFAPQISAALLTDEQRLKLPRFLEEEAKDPEKTKQAWPSDLVSKSYVTEPKTKPIPVLFLHS